MSKLDIYYVLNGKRVFFTRAKSQKAKCRIARKLLQKGYWVVVA